MNIGTLILCPWDLSLRNLFLFFYLFLLSKILFLFAEIEMPVLHGDIAVADTTYKNAEPCTATEKGCKWPKEGRYVYVPYYISPDYKEQNIIIRGMRSFNQTTCIRFIPWNPSVRNYISFFTQPNSGCWSYLGRQKGVQHISLERGGCVRYSTVQHEILHALGFNHEQVRSDRDRYVRILFNNIKRKQQYNFQKKRTNNLETPYDFSSVMHYNKYAFSKNGLPTIEAKGDPAPAFGNARQMSTNDIIRVNKLYRCSKLKTYSTFYLLCEYV
uniref:Metalloendopeptidase n=1 Tax=Cyprinodon variegatus TaxID=28743 RepID=A0A3Q2CF53_CYPVA